MYQLKKNDFMHRLNKEYQYLLDGSTSYRVETARVSLEVVNKTNNVNVFLNEHKTKRLISLIIDDFDDERKDDVAKMLRITAKKILSEQNRTPDAKRHAEKIMQNNIVIRKVSTKTFREMDS